MENNEIKITRKVTPEQEAKATLEMLKETYSALKLVGRVAYVAQCGDYGSDMMLPALEAIVGLCDMRCRMVNDFYEFEDEKCVIG